MVRPTVNTRKHVVQRSLTTIPNGTTENELIAEVVDVASANQSFEIREGATIKAVWVELWYIGEGSQPVVQISSLEKQVAGIAMTSVLSGDYDSYVNKKNVFKMTQGIVGDANSNPVPVFREWIAIPKGKQRFGAGDKLVLNITCSSEATFDLSYCGVFIYKEYY